MWSLGMTCSWSPSDLLVDRRKLTAGPAPPPGLTGRRALPGVAGSEQYGCVPGGFGASSADWTLPINGW